MRAYANFVVRNRVVVLVLSLVITVLMALQLRHLEVIVDADELLPRDHPFVEVTERVQAVFGNRYTVVIGVTPTSGDVYTPATLGKLLAVTDALIATPGVTPGNIQSLAAPRAKDIAGNAEGLVVSRLLDHVPASRAEALAIKERLAANPQYKDVLVSRDGRTAAIYVEFKKDPKGFGHVMRQVEAAIAPIRDRNTSIEVAGQPVFLGLLETFSKRMAWLLPIAILLIGVIHLEAFRTLQGLVLPLVTAILALIWSLGIMTLAGIHLDPFNNVTPILILAVAAGHAVQMLKRYYEEYDELRAAPAMDSRDANRQAVINSIIKVGPVMLAACTIASLSFMSLAWFDIQAIRTFGIFCGLGIISIAVVELTFTPALRAMLPAPRRREMTAEKTITFWDRFAATLAKQVSTPAARRRVFITAVVAAGVLAVGASRVHIDNSLRSFFGTNLAERQDDRTLNDALAGTNTFYVLVEGKTDDAIKDPAVLRAMAKTQAYLAAQPEIGHTLSVVDMLKQINRGMNGGGTAAGVLPNSAALVSQYLLLYSMSGEPGDFDGLVDYPYRNAIIQAFVKTDSSVFVADINKHILPVIKANFPNTVTVRLGGSITTPTAMNEVMVSGKIKNVIQIFTVVFIVGAVMFRSARLGALILVPLAATLLTVFGVMGFAGIPLQIATSTMAALAIGIGADYAIYLTWRLREELKGGTDEKAAIAATYASAGKAVLFVATAVAGGYAVLMASLGFNVHLWLGLLTSISMAAAALSTLTLYAALLLTIRPDVIFHRDGSRPADAPDAGLVARPAGIGFGLVLAGASLIYASPVVAQAVSQPNAADAARLMSESLKATKPQRSMAVGRFVLINPAGQQRVRETTSTTELKADGVNNRRVTRFNSPADIAGTSVLTVENTGDDDIWVYLPALKKVRRLSASSRRDAFVGTDFSYGDVLGHPVDEWTHRILRKEAIDGVASVVIESIPRDPVVAAATGYSRRISWLRAADMVPVKTEFFGPQQNLIKVYSAADIRLVDPAKRCFQPMRQVMKNVVTGHATIIEYSSFKTDVSVVDDQFQPRALERGR
ncbi:MAG: outer membrane lipoprotein-sorting protein [Acetobacteraceae bacterium]|nr:outer membrane lipoprotein-sorting protein [Acetobacteraceae bacterium]